jgi:hypothetical protein
MQNNLKLNATGHSASVKVCGLIKQWLLTLLVSENDCDVYEVEFTRVKHNPAVHLRFPQWRKQINFQITVYILVSAPSIR